MHLFSSHLSYFVKSFGDVDLFNIQGLEKLNDLTKSEFFRATNKTKYFCSQILTRRNRLENYRHLGNELRFNKRVNFRLKSIRKDIAEIDSKKVWCQFKFDEYSLNQLEINDFHSGRISQIKVINLN